MQAGTPGAVKEMVKIVFGEGDVVEWTDFEEPPYTPGTFDIVTNARLTPDILEYFTSIIDRVKNVRSHLRRILIKREWPLLEYAASNAVASPLIPVTNNAAPKDTGISMQEYASTVASSAPMEYITNNTAARASPIHALESAGALAYAAPKEVITNTMEKKCMEAHGAVSYFGASAFAFPKTAIGNTKAPGYASAVAGVSAAFSAFSAPRVVITNGMDEAAVWIKYGSKVAAAAASGPKITIGKGGMAENGRNF